MSALGPRLCENAKTLNRDRRSYSSKTRLVAQRARGFQLRDRTENIILHRVSIFKFSHSLGHFRPIQRDRRPVDARFTPIAPVPRPKWDALSLAGCLGS